MANEPIRVPVDKAKEMVDGGGAVILDVVDTPAYPQVPNQVEGAIRIEPEKIPEEYDRLDKDETVLAYCT